MRKCKVNRQAAVFHTWSEHAHVVEPSPMIGGSPGGQIKYPVAVVEYESGMVECVPVGAVIFETEN